MRQSTINNYINERKILNTPHFAAWGIATRCAKLGLHNLRNRFWPPIIESVNVMPLDISYQTEDKFDVSMFREGGFLHEEPLNHYIKLRRSKIAPPVMINAGYLIHHFLISDELGYQELARLLKYERTPNQIDTSTGPDICLQTESP